MSRKAASKWTIAFLAGFVLTAAVIFLVVVIVPIFHPVSCSLSQEAQISNVRVKVDEMLGRGGYETMVFEVMDCVERISYIDSSGNVSIKFTTANTPFQYFTNARWEETNGNPMVLTTPGKYTFRVFEERVEVLR